VAGLRHGASGANDDAIRRKLHVKVLA